MVSPFESLPYELIMKIFHYALAYSPEYFNLESDIHRLDLKYEENLNLENPQDSEIQNPDTSEDSDESDDSDDDSFDDQYHPEFFLDANISDLTIPWIISQVCGRWRQITLSDRTLWATAINYCTNPGRLELITRANPALVIYYAYDGINISYDLQLFEGFRWESAFARVSNWGSFSFVGAINADNMDPLVHALIHPAPGLVLFQINNLQMVDLLGDGLDSSNLNDRLLVLPDNIFAGHAPCLKKFEITNAYLRSSFNFSVWAGVTELFVNQCLGGLQGDKISSRRWLEVLGEMKQLEVLVLAWSYDCGYNFLYEFPPADVGRDYSIANFPDIRLDNLRTLGLVATSERNIMFDIFPKLVVPAECVTSIIVAHEDGRMLPFDWLQTGIHRRVHGWSVAHNSFRVHLMHGDGEFGFQLEQNPGPGIAKRCNYTIQFRCINFEPEANLPAGYLPDDPFLRMQDILEPFMWVSAHQPTMKEIEVPLAINFSVLEDVLKAAA